MVPQQTTMTGPLHYYSAAHSNEFIIMLQVKSMDIRRQWSHRNQCKVLDRKVRGVPPPGCAERRLIEFGKFLSTVAKHHLVNISGYAVFRLYRQYMIENILNSAGMYLAANTRIIKALSAVHNHSK
jgi:hypothetical protein